MIDYLKYWDSASWASQDPSTAQILIPIILSVGLMLLSALLFKPKKQQFSIDNKPNTATTRGSFIPLVIGTELVGPVVMWVGGRSVVVEQTESGGKGFLGGGASTSQTYIYYEKAIHALCVGPAARILGIYENGRLIPGTENIDRRLYPTGSAVTTDMGTFRVRWGEMNPGNTDPVVTAALGLPSEMPLVCCVVWDSCRIRNPNWPVIEYKVEVPPCASGVSPISQPAVGNGVNPAQALYQLQTANYPHGAAMAENTDFAALIRLGDLLAAEGVGLNMSATGGMRANEAVALVMQDFSIMAVEDSGILSMVPVRHELGSVPVLSDSLILEVPEITTLHVDGLGNQIVYLYDDEKQHYKPGSIGVDDDSESAIRAFREPKEIKFETITSREGASITVSRRQVEDLSTPNTVRVVATRGLRTAQPSQILEIPGQGRFRLVSSEVEPGSPETTLGLLRDPYQQAPIDFTDADLPTVGGSGPLLADIRYRVLELPFLFSGGKGKLVALRIRDNPSIFTATIIASNDGVTYSPIGNQTLAATGGIINADWNPGLWVFCEVGPTFVVDGNGDQFLVPENLTTNPALFFQGSQILVVGGEMMYVREMVQISGSTWRAQGVLRGRAGTGRAPLGLARNDWVGAKNGDEAYIIPAASLTAMTNPVIQSSGITAAKSLPANNLGQIPAGAVVPVDVVMSSQATRTPQIAWFECGGSRGCTAPEGRRDRQYVSNETIVFEWLPTARAGGAGTTGYGQPTEIAVPAGDFILDVWFDPSLATVEFENLTVQKTYTLPAASARGSDGIYRWNYTHAMRIIDGSDGLLSDDSPPTIWQISIRQVDGTEGVPTFIRPHIVSTENIPS